jgi:hypothetical protein
MALVSPAETEQGRQDDLGKLEIVAAGDVAWDSGVTRLGMIRARRNIAVQAQDFGHE